MRKLIITCVLLCLSFLYAKGQEVNYSVQAGGMHYIYVGSLPKSSIHVYEKLKIEIFGGSYEALQLGTTTYSIGTRNYNRINIERSGGYAADRFELVVYENGEVYDFVIQSTNRYGSFNIKSTLLKSAHNAITQPYLIDIKLYDPKGKTNVTSKFVHTIMTATDVEGNLGIGTLTPKSKLDVRGKIIADEVEVKVNKGADFVFEEDYELKNLSEVETFIKGNRHLPEIPSEKEMQENGLNVNDMQIKLLQKIEELTLYVIEQNKQINVLQENSRKQEVIIEQLQKNEHSK